MADIRIDYGAVSAAQENINSGETKLRSSLEQMEGDLAPLREQWGGEASTAYQQAKAQWDNALIGMADVLRQARGMLGSTGSDFQQTDTNAARRFGG